MYYYYKCPTQRAYLNLERTLRRISELPEDSKLVIFGAGLHSIPLFYRLEEEGKNIFCFCDNNSIKWGKQYCGKPIISPDELLAGKEHFFVLIGADYYADEIQKGLFDKCFPVEHVVSVREYKTTDLLLPKETLKSGAGLESTNFTFPKADEAENPLVTVRIVVYNEPLYYARRAIESILAQTFTALHLVIIENGATNELRQLVDTYAAKDKRISIVSFDKNHSGWSDAEYTTKYFCKLDGDDYYDPTFLERAVHAAEAYNADVVSVNSLNYYVSDPKKIRYCGFHGDNEIVLESTKEKVQGVFSHIMQFSSVHGKLYKIDKMFYLLYGSNVRTIPDSMVECIFDIGTIVIIPDILHYYTVRTGSVSTAVSLISDTHKPNGSTYSFYEIASKIYDGYLNVLKETDCMTLENTLIVQQLFMNNLNQLILPKLHALKERQPIEVSCFAKNMLSDSRVNHDLLLFPEHAILMKTLNEFARLSP